jgi:steroid delta-isomerase-like uncharacterized protein
MTAEDNKTIVRWIIEEGWNQGKVAVFDELCASDWIHHDPSQPHVRTREDFKRHVAETRRAFPDIHFTMEDVIAEGEQVVLRWMRRGTNTGDLVTPTIHLPATGKQVSVTGITIFRVASGKVVETWNQSDRLGMYQQLGLIPEPQPVG